MLGQGILRIFAESPLKPIMIHVDMIYDCANQLQPFIKEALAGNWHKAKELHERIVSIEHDADRLKKEIRGGLPSSLFMPWSRADLLVLLNLQDKIASEIKHLTGLIKTRAVSFPESIKEGYLKVVNDAVKAVQLVQNAVHSLAELMDAGFRGQDVRDMTDFIILIEELESETDNAQCALRESILSLESTLEPIDAMFLYKIIDWTAKIADRAHHVANTLETLMVK